MMDMARVTERYQGPQTTAEMKRATAPLVDDPLKVPEAGDGRLSAAAATTARKTLEAPSQVPTWHDTGDLLSNLGSIMIMLMRLGVDLREHKRLEVKFQHDLAIEHRLKGAEQLKKAAVATMVSAGLSLAVSVVMAGASMRAQKRASDIKTNVDREFKPQIDANNQTIDTHKASIDRLKADSCHMRPGPARARNDESITRREGKIAELRQKNVELQQQKNLKLRDVECDFADAQNMASIKSQFIMPLGNFVSSIGGGVSTMFQAKKAEEDAWAQQNSKVSDLASQDYQHFEDFFKEVLSALQSIVSEMNQAVKTATQI
jgi:hypothetical protein